MLPQDTSRAYTSEFVALIQKIRKRAYKSVPIFVLRPLDGALEQESWRVVNELRKAGDMQVHWIDTSSWTAGLDNMEQEERVAAYLSQHVCPFLNAPGDCNFLTPFESRSKKDDDE